MVKNKHNLENNPYRERWDTAKQLSGYKGLDETGRGIIAHLAFDQTLNAADFYKVAHEVIYEQAMGGRCP